MTRRAERAAALLLFAPFLTLASALAPEHVHEPGPGHEQAVAHSHFAPHNAIAHHDDVTEIEHDIEHVVWLDSSTLHEAPYRTAPAAIAVPVSHEIVSTDMHWTVTQFEDAAPAHGPPKDAPRFRGPPPSLV